MSERKDPTELARLIEGVSAALETARGDRAAFEFRDYDKFQKARGAAISGLVKAILDQGGTVSSDWSSVSRIKLHGIKSSSTTGVFGAVANWIAAAKTRQATWAKSGATRTAALPNIDIVSLLSAALQADRLGGLEARRPRPGADALWYGVEARPRGHCGACVAQAAAEGLLTITKSNTLRRARITASGREALDEARKRLRHGIG